MIRFTCILCGRSDRKASWVRAIWCEECYELRWKFYNAADELEATGAEIPFKDFEIALGILHDQGFDAAMRHVTDHLTATSNNRIPNRVYN